MSHMAASPAQAAHKRLGDPVQSVQMDDGLHATQVFAPQSPHATQTITEQAKVQTPSSPSRQVWKPPAFFLTSKSTAPL